MRARSVARIALALLLPLPALAQGPGGGRGGGMGAAFVLVEQGSVEYLTTRAEDLGLSDAQVTRLTAIAAEFDERTGEQRERIRANMPQRMGGPRGGGGGGARGGGGRGEMMQRMQELQPLFQSLLEEDRTSTEKAMEVLDEAQRTVANRLLAERTPQGRGRGG